jgi:DNA repair exonuclease SbcCD ATPase subunit
MVFDLTSFLVGVAAGAVTGGLAGILHSLERTADIQERVRAIAQEVEGMKAHLSETGQHEVSQLDDLDQDLEEIHEEIRRMYKRTTR